MDLQYGTVTDEANCFYDAKKAAYPLSGTPCPIIYEQGGKQSLFLALETTWKISSPWWLFGLLRKVEARTNMMSLPLVEETE